MTQSPIVQGKLKSGEYFDSVTLMKVAKQITSLPGVVDAAVVMGTKENKSILAASGMLLSEFESAADSDLLICVKAISALVAKEILSQVDLHLKSVRTPDGKTSDFVPRSLDSALKSLPNANLALISVAGKYAAEEAFKALRAGMHVMIFSDNVSIEDEVQLKKYAREQGLIVMGPDCGTAIINGVPLAFANVVQRGNIGIVAASGTGLQEVTCIISNSGGGISQALGTGGRDIKAEVGGIMFLESIQALAEDPATRVIVLVSKPPHPEVLKKVQKALQGIQKPVVAVFLGAAQTFEGIHTAKTLEEAALLAVCLAQNQSSEQIYENLQKRTEASRKKAQAEAQKLAPGQKFIRGLFSGGTFCNEAQVLFRELLPNHAEEIWSNAPMKPYQKLANAWKSQEHSVVDLGEDEFTVGRPHPMIDFSLRNRKIIEESGDPETAVLLLDVVLGYGSNKTPLEEIAPFIRQAKEQAAKGQRHLSVVCSVTGTDQDPQNRSRVENGLRDVGAWVLPTNAAACEFAAAIISAADQAGERS